MTSKPITHKIEMRSIELNAEPYTQATQHALIGKTSKESHRKQIPA